MSVDLSKFSKMQQYYLSKQLPGFATNPSEQRIQKKDRHFYADTNIWNNRTRLDSKVNSTYQQQLEASHVIENIMETKQKEDKLIKSEKEKDILRAMREQDKRRISQRKKERLIMQLESMQDFVIHDTREIAPFEAQLQLFKTEEDTIQYDNRLTRTQRQTSASGRAPNAWNKINEASKKFVEMAVNPKIIQSDEEAVAAISRRIQTEREVEQMRTNSFAKVHQEQRELFLKQHQRNRELECKSGQLRDQKPVVLIQSLLSKQMVAEQHKKGKLRDNSKENDDKLKNLNKEDDIEELFIIQYNDKNNQTSKKNIDMFNIGDDAKNKNRLLSSNKASKKNRETFHNHHTHPRQEEDASVGLQAYLDSQLRPQQSGQRNSLNAQFQTSSIEQTTLPDLENQSNLKKTPQRPTTALIRQQNSHQSSASAASLQRPPTGLKYQENTKDIMNIQDSNGSEAEHAGSLDESQRNNKYLKFQPSKTGGFQSGNNTISRKFSQDREFLTSADSHAKKTAKYPLASQQQNGSNQILAYSMQKPDEKFEFKNLDGPIQPITLKQTSLIQRLAEPKSKEFEPKNFLERSDFKGLLAAEVTCEGSEFGKAMLAQSNLANSYLASQTRPQTRCSKISKITQTSTHTLSFARPATTASLGKQKIFKNMADQGQQLLDSDRPNPIRSQKEIQMMNQQAYLENDKKQELMDEIDRFDKKYRSNNQIKMGFSQTNLLQFRQKETFMSAKSAMKEKTS